MEYIYTPKLQLKMKTHFDILRKSRELVLNELEGLSLAQLHTIPQGFKNHIAI